MIVKRYSFEGKARHTTLYIKCGEREYMCTGFYTHKAFLEVCCPPLKSSTLIASGEALEVAGGLGWEGGSHYVPFDLCKRHYLSRKYVNKQNENENCHFLSSLP